MMQLTSAFGSFDKRESDAVGFGSREVYAGLKSGDIDSLWGGTFLQEDGIGPYQGSSGEEGNG